MKNLLLLLLVICFSASAQSKFITKTGVITFEASVPSFENVAAKNSSVTAIINVESGEIAALALVKGFRFKNALMEEHFNENYAESDQFPKATFKGKIDDFDIKSINTNYTLNGTLEFHGKSKSINNITVKANLIDNKISLIGSFQAKASDFDIEIPKIVSNKIAKDILISFEFELLKK